SDRQALGGADRAGDPEPERGRPAGRVQPRWSAPGHARRRHRDPAGREPLDRAGREPLDRARWGTRPLDELEKELVLKGPIIWTDDTTVTVLVGEKGAATRGGSGCASAARSSPTMSMTSRRIVSGMGLRSSW